MYVCMYVYMYLCMHVYLSACLPVSVSLSVCLSVCIYLFMHIYAFLFDAYVFFQWKMVHTYSVHTCFFHPFPPLCDIPPLIHFPHSFSCLCICVFRQALVQSYCCALLFTSQTSHHTLPPSPHHLHVWIFSREQSLCCTCRSSGL